ncbi:MAG: flavoprotein [Ignisphaera sp.]|uniref:4Fe-4S ferredoxin-type domain-containing protein n=1 Tax=Ignisphaera aggregans TaxID=334771 RepID=A0A7C4NKJ3_9CREN
MINIAWCITGAGASLRAVVKCMHRVKERINPNITLFLTRWGFEVARIFGVLEDLKVIADNSYYREFLVENEGMFYIGRLNLGRYSLLVIAPATANSIAKMVLGIADNIASALYAQAVKSGVPVIVMPTDIPRENGFTESEAPCYIDKALCSIDVCGTCPPMQLCPVNAVTPVGRSRRIDLSKCIGCGRCVAVCIGKASRCWERIKLKPREVDVENVRKLSRDPLTTIVSGVDELELAIERKVKELKNKL